MANMSRVIKRSVDILVMLLLAVLIGCDGGATAKVGIVDIEQVATAFHKVADHAEQLKGAAAAVS